MGIIDTLFSECEGYLELRSIGKTKEQAFFRLNDSAAISQWIKERKNKSNLYFAVATRDGGGGKAQNIVSIPAVWVDMDFKHIPGEKGGADKLLEDFPLKPTIIVGTGGGYHVYWKLKEPVTLQESEVCEAIMRGLTKRRQGDMDCSEVPRVIRIPETKNFKYTAPRKVKMLHCNGSEFALSDFEDFMDY